MNLQTCNKFGANLCIRFVVTRLLFFIFDPITPPPQMPSGLSRGWLFLAYVHSKMNPHMYAKCGAILSSHLVDFPDFV